MGRSSARIKRHRQGNFDEDGQSSGKQPNQEPEDDPQVDFQGFYCDEVDKFHDLKEKILLEKSGYHGDSGDSSAGELSEGEEEVLHLSDLESDQEEEELAVLPPSLRKFYHSDDDDDLDGDKRPEEISDKAWGRSKKAFYSTDYVDPELTGSSEEEEAEMEEREALTLQQRMAATLDEHDFDISKEEEEEREEVGREKEEVVIRDLSKLSREEKIAILEKDSPELFELLEEFRSKFSEAVDTLYPLVQASRKDPDRFSAQGAEFLEIKLHLFLCYCLNIMFYLRLKSCKTPVLNHPVIARIVQIRQLIGQLQPVDRQLEPQVKEVLDDLGTHGSQERMENGPTGSKGGTEVTGRKRKAREENSVAKKPKKLPTSSESDTEASDLEDTRVGEEPSHPPEDPLTYYRRVKAEKMALKKAKLETRQRQVGAGQREEEEGEDGKRALSYQIARNKGLTPHRKKEQRNPRVRHRKKYQKALIKRKSQVRPVETEMERYGGERTGIRANLTRSIKIK